MSFSPGRKPSQDLHLPSLWFIVDQGQVLVRSNAGLPSFPDDQDLCRLGLAPSGGFYLGATNSRVCLLEHGDASAAPAEGYEWVDLRSLFGAVEEDLFWIAGRAHHLAAWDRAHRWCGACSQEMGLKEDEWAKTCAGCGQTYYPQISPAVIVSVVDGDRILLARNRCYRYPFFSVLAGFVEPGEDLESAVHREVLEEAGITVKNLHYFGSQPWPFPNSLMIAFTAEYDRGELDPDPSEILEARWFTRDAMPDIPSSMSIARRLIDAFARQNISPN